MTSPGMSVPARLRAVGRDVADTMFVEPVRGNVVHDHRQGPVARTAIAIGVLSCLAPAIVIAGAPWWLTTRALAWPTSAPGFWRFGWPPVVPLVILSLAFGGGIMLVGAVSCPPRMAWTAVAGLVLFSLVLISYAKNQDSPGPGLVVALVAAALQAPVVALLRWRKAPTWVSLPVCVSLTVCVQVGCLISLIGRRDLRADGLLDQAAVITPLDSFLVYTSDLALPAIIAAGAGAVSLGITLTRLAARALRTLVLPSRWILVATAAVLLAGSLVVAVLAVVRGVRTAGVLGTLWPIVVVALVVAAATRWWSWAAARARDPESGSGALGLRLGLVLAVVPLASLVLAASLQVVSALSGTLGPTEAGLAIVTWLSQQWLVLTYRMLAGVGLVVWAVWRARKHPGSTPAWAGLAGFVLVVRTVLTIVGSDQTRWFPTTAFQIVGTGAVALAAVLAVVRRRRPSPDRLLAGIGVLVFFGLVLQSSYLSDPYGPLIGYSGPFFVLIGLTWSFVTSGGHRKKEGGLGRTLVLLGYAVLPLAMTAWRTTSGQLVTQDQGLGRGVFGTAVLLAFAASWLPAVFADRPAEPDPAPSPDPDVTLDPPTVPIPALRAGQAGGV